MKKPEQAMLQSVDTHDSPTISAQYKHNPWLRFVRWLKKITSWTKFTLSITIVKEPSRNEYDEHHQQSTNPLKQMPNSEEVASLPEPGNQHLSQQPINQVDHAQQPNLLQQKLFSAIYGLTEEITQLKFEIAQKQIQGIVLPEHTPIQSGSSSKVTQELKEETRSPEVENEQRLNNQETLQPHQEPNFSILRPIILDLIDLYDDLEQLKDSPIKASLSREQMEKKYKNNLIALHMYVTGVLSKYNVHTFSREDTIFYEKVQKPIETEPTTNPELDLHIAKHLRTGFSYKDRILRPEWVSVYTYKKEE